jgi:hypothetical protein
MRKILFLLPVVLALMIGAAFAEHDPVRACSDDADCFRTGCSGQLCANQDIITTCEFRCEYGCYSQAQCQCFGDQCAFAHDQVLHECLRQCRAGASINPDVLPAVDASGQAEILYFTYRAKLPLGCVLGTPLAGRDGGAASDRSVRSPLLP